MWFAIALTGYAFLAIVAILDKFIVSKSVRPVVYSFYSTIFMFGALLALPFVGWEFLKGVDWLWACASGIAFGLGMWTLYLAVKKGEATHISPFNGAMVSIFIYFLASFFLSEKLTGAQICGIAILVFASLLLSFEKTRTHSGFHIGFIWAILSGLLFAISHVSAKYLYGIYPFWPAFIWTRASTGLVGLLLLLSPSVRETFRKRHSTGVQAEPKTFGKRHALGLVLSNKILSVLAIVLIQFAMSAGSVTLVGALSGLQFSLMFLFVYLSTKFLPRVFKEYFTKREIAVEMIAMVLVAIGSVFFVI